MIKIEKLNESHLRLTGDIDEVRNISDHFTFKVPGCQFMPSYKCGAWDGRIRLMDKHGKLPIGLYKRLKDVLRLMQIDFESDFKQISINISEETIKKYLKEVIKSDLELRDFQINGIITAFKEQQCGIISPTASGKSLIQFLIAMLSLKLSKDAKVLLIVPTISLVSQMQGDFLDYNRFSKTSIDNDIHTIYSGKEKCNNKKIIISTWQSLATIKDPNFFKSFSTVLTDEFHGAEKAEVIQRIIQNCSNAKMKIGVSGTVNDEKINKIQLEGLFGPVHQFTTTKKLMKNGTLSDLKIQVLVLKYPDDRRKLCHKLPYPDEMQLIRDNEDRLKLIVNLTKKINKNILVLFKNIDYGKSIYEEILSLKLDRKIHYVAGSTKAELREEVRKIATSDHNGIIVASLGVFATGINIPSLDYVIFSQPSKSKIKVLQSIGRILRKTDKKNKAYLIDIVDDLTWKRKKNFAMSHGMSRLEIYDKEQFNYDIKEIEL